MARLNPLSYEVDALRGLMIHGGESAFGIGTDFGLLVSCTVALIAIAARVYPRVVT